MSATGPSANILSERAALLAVVAGAVETVAEEDGLGLEEEVKVAGREPVEAPKVEEIVGSGVVEEMLETVEDVLEAVATEVVGEVTGEDDNGDSVIGPGPRLNIE